MSRGSGEDKDEVGKRLLPLSFISLERAGESRIPLRWLVGLPLQYGSLGGKSGSRPAPEGEVELQILSQVSLQSSRWGAEVFPDVHFRSFAY